MKNFHQWCEERKLELPSLISDDGEEANASENRIRTGIRGVYPSGYVRNQYPDSYYMPRSASAGVDLQNAKATKDKAAPDKTPL